jgi:hypothetical protein
MEWWWLFVDAPRAFFHYSNWVVRTRHLFEIAAVKSLNMGRQFGDIATVPYSEAPLVQMYIRSNGGQRCPSFHSEGPISEVSL